MAPVWVFMIIFAIILIISITLIYKMKIDNDWILVTLFASGLAVAICLTIGIFQSAILKRNSIRYEKEREQIIYQIENMTENTDKIKLNEWILTYNDWINDVNASKEAFGWFSWYWSFDMSEHTIINLV